MTALWITIAILAFFAGLSLGLHVPRPFRRPWDDGLPLSRKENQDE